MTYDLPNNRESEEAVIALMIFEPTLVAEVLALTSDDMFFTAFNKRAYIAIRELFEVHEDITTITLAEKLDANSSDKARLIEINNKYLHYGLHGKFKTHVKILDSAREQRSMLQAIAEIVGLINSNEPNLVATAHDLIDELTKGAVSGFPPTLQEALEALLARKVSDKIIPSGFLDIDHLLNGGLRPGQLVIIAARTSVGKTTAALQMTINACLKGVKTVYVSMEMPEDQLTARIFSVMSGVPTTVETFNEMDSDKQNTLDEMKKLPLYLYCKGYADIRMIQGMTQLVLGGSEDRLLVVDYLQLVEGSKGSDSQEQRIASVARGLRQIALDFNMPVIALSQLSRAAGSKSPGGKALKPDLRHLRESGAIEQEASVVLLFDRDINPDREDLTYAPNEVSVQVAKNRIGKTGERQLIWDQTSGRFMNYYKDPESQIESSKTRKGGKPPKEKYHFVDMTENHAAETPVAPETQIKDTMDEIEF